VGHYQIQKNSNLPSSKVENFRDIRLQCHEGEIKIEDEELKERC